MEEQFLVHEFLQLFTTPDKFYLKPSQLCRHSSSEVLIIDRVSGSATVQNVDLVKLLGPEEDFKLIFGFLGSIKLISGLYLVVVTDRILVESLNGHDIFRVVSTEIIPYAKSTDHLTNQQMEDNEDYESMVRLILDLPGAYFSCSYDLTHTLQRLHTLYTLTPELLKKSLTYRADTRFVWNRYLLKDFTDEQYGRFTLPFIQGFVSINPVVVNGHNLTWSLVSRRSVDRTGSRLFVRGIDAQGNVANHVITEQIIEYGATSSSFVLTRGSVPLPWTQYPDLSFIPTPVVARGDHVTMFIKHMDDQKRENGNIVCVNLLGQHGKEGILEEGYRTAATAADMEGIKYRPFDFHSECRSLRYDKLDILVNTIADELEEYGHFFSDGDAIVKRQSGTFRVNCQDCLDRTNVVQSILAKLRLKTTLKHLAVIGSDDEEHPGFDHLVNNVWADHADMLSMQYTGTGALMTDFTRTGKRTYQGVFNDAISAMVRYYNNNFNDGFLQDAFDVYLGNYEIPDSKSCRQPSPLRRQKDWKSTTFPAVFLLAVSMMIASIILPQNYSIKMLLYLVFWATIAAGMISYVCRNRKEFVDWPKLCAGERAAAPKPKLLSSADKQQLMERGK